MERIARIEDVRPGEEIYFSVVNGWISVDRCTQDKYHAVLYLNNNSVKLRIRLGYEVRVRCDE